MLTVIAWILLVSPVLVFGYAYFGYPLCLVVLSRFRRQAAPPKEVQDWPQISITVPVYNEEAQIRGTLDSLLRIDYPADRRQILVVSDASSDRTDEIVREYADRGIELLRMENRGGKGAAENAAAQFLRGEIVVNTDATIRIDPNGLKPLIAAFSDPTVGVASGRDISVARVDTDSNRGEAGYVGYEMWIRSLESKIQGIVGASGCYYGIRPHLHRAPLPGSLSRDFASALTARDHGYRAVSVDEATCLVPRAASLHREYKRKVRTMTRGMETLFYKRHLLNPVRHGVFAWMLLSHKVTRWAAPWTIVLALLGLLLLTPTQTWAIWLLAATVFGAGWAWLGWMVAHRSTLPRILAIPTYLSSGNLAALHASLRALRGNEDAIWEPTRRETLATR
jgi:cellulose synthase/poly-beta-1,6-N-acetylglucosamine synthase-like glycosyltransferase